MWEPICLKMCLVTRTPLVISLSFGKNGAEGLVRQHGMIGAHHSCSSWANNELRPLTDPHKPWFHVTLKCYTAGTDLSAGKGCADYLEGHHMAQRMSR